MVTAEAPVADALTSDVEAPGFPAVRIPRRYVINHSGKDYVLADGLLHGLHALSGGHFDIETRVEQLPGDGNGQLAVASARITVFAGDESGRVLRASAGIGDASPQNVSRQMLPHLMRMAETRAKARALRDLLNVAAVSFEELGPGGGEDSPDRHAEGPSRSYTPQSPSFPAPVARAASETFTIDGRPFTRPQIVGVYRQRLLEAQRAGLQLAPAGTQGAPPAEDAPLPAIVRFSSELKRRLEARSGNAGSSGK